MRHAFARLLTAGSLAAGMLLSAQSLSQSDPSHRGDPMYSKSDKKKMDKYRMVHGIVKDEQDNPLSGALVNLKNMKTKQTLTFITKSDGKYMFDELNRDEDYEISASFSGKSTPVKKLSHFDPQTNSMRILSFVDQDDETVQKVTKK